MQSTLLLSCLALVCSLPWVLCLPARSYTSFASDGSMSVIAGGSASLDCSSGFLGDVYVVHVHHNATVEFVAQEYNLATPRCGLASAISSGRVFFAGGNSDTGYSSTVDVFEQKSGRELRPALVKSPELRLGRSYMTGCATRENVYFVGGYTVEYGISDLVEVLSLSSPPVLHGPRNVRGARNSRRTLEIHDAANLPDAVLFHSSACSQDQVFVAGGTTSDAFISNAVYAFSEESSRWSLFGGLSTNRTKTASALVSLSETRGYLLVAGGEGESEDWQQRGSTWECRGSLCFSSAVDVLPVPATLSLPFVLRMTQYRSRFASATAGCFVAFAGGLTPLGPSGVVDVFDMCTTPVQQATAELSIARFDVVGNVADSKWRGGDGHVKKPVFVFIGGTTAYGVTTGAVDVLDVADISQDDWFAASSTTAYEDKASEAI